MKAAEALIAWNGPEGFERNAPALAIAVGPLPAGREPDWTEGYFYTGGASNVERRDMGGLMQQFHVLREFYMLVYVYGLDPYVVHRAFLHIDEYQEIIKEMGAGPDRDELGHDPEVGFGRASKLPVPDVDERRIGRSTHIWPK